MVQSPTMYLAPSHNKAFDLLLFPSVLQFLNTAATQLSYPGKVSK